jgi:hypothetical protein
MLTQLALRIDVANERCTRHPEFRTQLTTPSSKGAWTRSL